MHKSKSNHLVFYMNSALGIILQVVYADDMVITRSDNTSISSLKSYLDRHFQTKDLRTLKHFLGIEVMRSKKGGLIPEKICV